LVVEELFERRELRDSSFVVTGLLPQAVLAVEDDELDGVVSKRVFHEVSYVLHEIKKGAAPRFSARNFLRFSSLKNPPNFGGKRAPT
jgi:hypothetical protein